MIVNALPKTMTEAEALTIARGGGNILGRMMYGKRDIQMRLMYFESREIILKMTFPDAPLLRLFRGNRTKSESATQFFRTVVEGTRGGASYLPDALITEEIEVDECSIQPAEIPGEKMVGAAKYLCRRLVRRQMGKTIHSEVSSNTPFYRPFYVAFYGELEEGTRVRYLPIPADGNSIQRTF